VPQEFYESILNISHSNFTGDAFGNEILNTRPFSKPYDMPTGFVHS